MVSSFGGMELSDWNGICGSVTTWFVILIMEERLQSKWVKLMNLLGEAAYPSQVQLLSCLAVMVSLDVNYAINMGLYDQQLRLNEILVGQLLVLSEESSKLEQGPDSC